MTSTQNSNYSLTRRAAITLCLATSLFFAFRAASTNAQALNSVNVAHDENRQVDAETLVDRANVSTSTVEPEQLITQNIQDIRLGQRVVGTNPLREQTQPASDIQPETWRAVRLNMIQGGVEYDLAFLRSLSWIESTGAQVGHSIHLELHEMGLDGPAQVVAIEPCPEIEPDDGTGRNVVTGTMAHPGDNILYLDITGLDEPLGVTDTHPIWSETRQDFVLAGQLEVGEQFRTLTGDSATLTNIVPHRGPPQMVFNLEVDGEHVYSVAGNGLLVHNVCPWDIGYSRSVSDATETFAHGPWKGRTVQDAIDEARKTGTLPEGLELHADFVNDQWVAANNRTLFVAQEAGLSQVHPTTGAGTLNSILKHLSETGIPLWR